jgi:pseudoazurin
MLCSGRGAVCRPSFGIVEKPEGMSLMMNRFALAAVFTIAFATSGHAADHQVKMLNKDSKGQVMQFEPAFLKVAPGDTITFVATDKGHDSESIKDGIPEGAEAWKGKISQDVIVTFPQEGLYAYKCTPHFGLGMVGLVQVGDGSANLAAIQGLKLPGKAKTRMTELLAEVSK